MATTITWKIEQLERNVSDGGIFTAHWRVNASETVDETTYSSTVYGTIGFTPDASSESFISYDNLTEEIVIGWVKEHMGEEQVSAHETSLQNQIDTQKNPPTASGMPWVS